MSKIDKRHTSESRDLPKKVENIAKSTYIEYEYSTFALNMATRPTTLCLLLF